jgi:hypothetical protein
MKKEVIKVSQDKDFLEFIEETFGKSITRKWIYIDQLTIDILAKKQSLCYMDTNGKLHIAYGNIIVEAYSHDYSWYKLELIDSENIKYSAAADPEEIIFIQIRKIS